MQRCARVETLENRTLLAAAAVIYGSMPIVTGSTVSNVLVRIAAGDKAPSSTDGTDFSYMYGGGETSRTFVIKNTGNMDMTIALPSISGPGAAAFSLSGTPPETVIAAGATQQFGIKFSPVAAGDYQATITVHRDGATSDYAFAIDGKCVDTQLLDGGLRIATVNAGTGTAVAADDTVLKVNYTGWRWADGLVFDSSLNKGRTPFTFDLGVGSVIQGWDKGMIGAKVGEKRVLFVPYTLGYGDQGASVAIPGHTDLIFSTQVVAMVTTVQDFRSAFSTTGNGHVIASGRTSWTHVDGTAFYSSRSSASAAYKSVTHTFILDLGDPVVLEALQGNIAGGRSSNFYVTKTKLLGGGRMSVSVTYYPTTTTAPAVPGSVKDDQLIFGVGIGEHGSYSIPLHGETLADGVKLTKTSLSVAGTAGADTATLAEANHVLSVTLNGVKNSFNVDDLTGIAVKAGAGNDTITADTVTHGMRLDGGAGDDVIKGGSGNDTIIGGIGNDVLTGGAGGDSLVGGAGTNTFYADDSVADTLDGAGGVNNVGKWDDGIDLLLRGTPTKLI